MTTFHPSGVQHALYPLTAPIKDYAWGSTTLLPELTGAPASNTPQAEMWFGTHPTTPTLLADGTALAELVDLPYLVKLLAAAQPLSIQAHPTIEHAKAGFAAENAAGIELSDPRRTYRDANHKPEMLVALSDFTAMTGFRDPDSAAGTFEQIAQMVDNTELTGVLTAMAEGLRAGELIAVFGQLVDPDGPFWQPDGFTAEIFAAVQRSGTDDKYLVNAHEAAVIHPNDPGALVTLLMNLITLAPGEALFIPSGTIHAYVAGLGLEVMATSDNVIRGGLTVKHVDVAELGKVVDFTPGAPPIITPSVRTIDNVLVTRFTPPVEDFALTRYDLPAGSSLTVTATNPRIAVGTSGTGTLTSGPDQAVVSPGSGIYIPGDVHSLDLSAPDDDVTIFLASRP
ncbi:MAG TPA: mannose-6-phosphate isomerase, class I [Enteractinococcus helveticum]|uniref:mannose-6-phosphate isomerase n=1 Tax=Enteractinococcus helveticum TaxID=1837282 RepID=A0A921K6L1_9MICC|nr:mannose-6-phosphate isomerase, class I [Enteractinococcus helveticum]HJF13760.1 mannose-6-phosphate isomerase, class I [Enteractinococcus helveticum]